MMVQFRFSAVCDQGSTARSNFATHVKTAAGLEASLGSASVIRAPNKCSRLRWPLQCLSDGSKPTLVVCQARVHLCADAPLHLLRKQGAHIGQRLVQFACQPRVASLQGCTLVVAHCPLNGRLQTDARIEWEGHMLTSAVQQGSREFEGGNGQACRSKWTAPWQQYISECKEEQEPAPCL